MNTDIRIITSFRNSRKRRRLARQLGDKAVVCLLDLWIATAVSRPEGRLNGWDELDIADEAGWDGEPEVFVNTLLDIGFLDRLEDNTFAIHNWEKHNPWAAGADRRNRDAKRAAARRWGFEAKENVPANQQAPAPYQQAVQPSLSKGSDCNKVRENTPGMAADRIQPVGGAAPGKGQDAGKQAPGQEDAPQEEFPQHSFCGHPYKNGENDANLCQAHTLGNAQSEIGHTLGNAQSEIGHTLGNAQSETGHTLGNAPSPSPYPYPSPSPSLSPGLSPGLSPATKKRGPPEGSVRARASPNRGQTTDRTSFKKIPPCPHKEVISLFHRCLPNNPRVENWTARNKAELALAWQADPARQSLDWWQDLFLRIVAPNRFLTGKKGGFAASLGWIVKPSVFGRILAGSYNDFTPNRDQGPALWYMEQAHARQGQNDLCQGNGSPIPDVRPGGAARQNEDGHLL
jgi:hypothetical protein